MPKEKINRKESRAAALATLKSRRQQYQVSALDSYDASAATDAQDIYDDLGEGERGEAEYRKRVEANLAKEDFVVDDGEFFLLFVFCFL